LDRHEPTPEDEDALASVNRRGPVVWVPDGISERESVRRILHEWAHVRLDHFACNIHRNQAETEADSVAWIVAMILGMEFSETAFNYLVFRDPVLLHWLDRSSG